MHSIMPVFISVCCWCNLPALSVTVGSFSALSLSICLAPVFAATGLSWLFNLCSQFSLWLGWFVLATVSFCEGGKAESGIFCLSSLKENDLEHD